MRINDFMNNIEIVKDNILQSEKEYLKLLKVVGSNQRYDFLTQLSIYDKVPNAKACARYDYWKKQYNRVASKGEKGIPYLVDKDKKSIEHIFDISQTTPIVKNINKIRSIDYWQFDFSSDINILKNTISENNFEPSKVLNENIFLLSRLYGDEDIDVALNDLRITADKKLSFRYPIDVDNVKQNLQNLTPISLEYIGNIISTTSHNIIEDIREKSVELKRTKGLTNANDILYNSTKVERRDIGGIENELRGESERIRGDGDRESVRSVRGHGGDSLQDKLIALHDLDVPWRPSDLEQRAGRIVRQGNENKEVNIFRYVTENTFDAYLWQTIENKQKFISQIMTSKTPARVAEDVDEASLSYSEIKALATGNPLIKEKMDLDNEVSKLKMLEANYNSNKYKLQDKVNIEYPQSILKTKLEIEAVKEDMSSVEKQGVGENKFTSITLNNYKITDKKEAGEKLLDEIRKVNIHEKKVIGKYRNFDLQVSYYGEFSSFADGNITRLDNVISKMSERLEKLKQNLEGYEASLENAKEELTKPFEKADELKNKTLRLAEINKLLDLGDVNEIENNSPLLEDLKRTIIDYANYEFSEDNPYEAFDKLYPDLEHISLAFTHTPDGKHTIQYEINAENKSWTQYVDDMPIRTESFLEDGISEQEAINNMIEVIKMSSFDDLVSVDSEDLRNALGLEIDDDGNFYDPLAKDLDNDGVPDRYDNDFRDSDYFESTYDVENNLHNRGDKEDKPSVLSQIKEFKEEESKSISRDNAEKEFER